MLPKKNDDTPVWLERAISMYDKDARKDGDLLSHDWIKWALDIPEPKTLDQADEVQWMMLSRMDAFREWLLVERKTALQNVRGRGYRIVPPHEQGQYAAEQAMKLVKKGLEHGDKLMTHVRMSEMGIEEQKRHTDAHVRLCGIADMVKRQKRDVFKLFAPPAAIPPQG